MIGKLIEIYGLWSVICDFPSKSDNETSEGLRLFYMCTPNFPISLSPYPLVIGDWFEICGLWSVIFDSLLSQITKSLRDYGYFICVLLISLSRISLSPYPLVIGDWFKICGLWSVICDFRIWYGGITERFVVPLLITVSFSSTPIPFIALYP